MRLLSGFIGLVFVGTGLYEAVQARRSPARVASGLNLVLTAPRPTRLALTATRARERLVSPTLGLTPASSRHPGDGHQTCDQDVDPFCQQARRQALPVGQLLQHDAVG